MRAIVQERYGSPERLRLAEVDDPVPSAQEVLVRVRAASVNAYDWHVMRGDPYIARLMAPGVFGPRGPRRRIRGRDLAGVVEAVGDAVTTLKVGDAVFGDAGLLDGAFAELARVPQDRLARIPAELGFEEAAAAPLAGTTAYRALAELAAVRPGQRVLVNGASGGVGTFAVQIAIALGAEVTAVCSTRNAELVATLGAHHVVDYRREDFTQTAERYDTVLDLVGNRALDELAGVAADDGILLLSGGGTSNGPTVFGPMRRLIAAQLRARSLPQRVVVMTGDPPVSVSLAGLAGLIDRGAVRPIIDRTYPLEQVPDAIRYVETEHARAKVVVTV